MRDAKIKKLRREREKYEGVCKENPLLIFGNGPNMRFQSSPKVAPVPHLEKAKALGKTNKRHLNKRIVTLLAESPYALPIKLLEANLINKIPIRQPDQHQRISTPKVGVYIILMPWVVIQISDGH